jgi:hypothetical protein
MAVMGKGRNKWHWFLIALFVLVSSILLSFFALPGLLIAAPQTGRVDAILHTVIDPRSSSDQYVVGLYHQGVASKIVCVSSQISVDLYPADYAREHLISLGIPAENVLSLRLPVTDCAAQSLKLIADYLKSSGGRSALLVCNPEDSRYGSFLARRVFDRQQLNLFVTYAPEDKEELTSQWWRTHWKVQRFVGQVINIPIDLLYSECR